MNVEYQLLWDGSQLKDRGLLCALDAMHATKPAPAIERGATLNRLPPLPVEGSTCQRLTAALKAQPLTAADLKAQYGVSQNMLYAVLSQLRRQGRLRSRVIARTFAGPRKVYWIQA